MKWIVGIFLSELLIELLALGKIGDLEQQLIADEVGFPAGWVLVNKFLHQGGPFRLVFFL